MNKNSSLKTKLHKGFTLIELLIVISIIGILVALVSASFLTAQKNARDSRRKTDLEQIRQALESYRAENGSYPLLTDDLTPSYITTLPTDPRNGTYAYSRTALTTYTLCAGLEITPSSPATCSLDCGDITCNYLTQNP